MLWDRCCFRYSARAFLFRPGWRKRTLLRYTFTLELRGSWGSLGSSVHRMARLEELCEVIEPSPLSLRPACKSTSERHYLGLCVFNAPSLRELDCLMVWEACTKLYKKLLNCFQSGSVTVKELPVTLHSHQHLDLAGFLFLTVLICVPRHRHAFTFHFIS